MSDGTPAASRGPHASDPVFPGLVITCEHGGNRIPGRFAAIFAGHEGLLASHRGWDPGALPLARSLAKTLSAPLFFSTTSRLLVDLNRSPGHPRVFSELTRGLPARERSEIMTRWYRPYRRRVERELRHKIRTGDPVIHLSIHSFTPVLDGKTREVDLGILYDPSRKLEGGVSRRLAGSLREVLASSAGTLRVRCNQPYRGTSDGLTTCLRRRFSDDGYAGIELEVNQRLIAEAGEGRELIRRAFLKAVPMAILNRRGEDPARQKNRRGSP